MEKNLNKASFRVNHEKKTTAHPLYDTPSFIPLIKVSTSESIYMITFRDLYMKNGLPKQDFQKQLFHISFTLRTILTSRLYRIYTCVIFVNVKLFLM